MKNYFSNKYIHLTIAIAALIILSIPLILPYFHTGYFPTQDGEWAVVRAGEMFREVKDLQFPPRFSGALNFGYGYPLFNFAYPFPYYLTLILHTIGLSFITSVKLLFALSIPLSAIFMFLFSKRLWKNELGGFFTAVLYIFVPYRMVDLYIRGSIGESLAFVWYPLIFYFLLRFLKEKNIFFGILASISLASLITTHNIMAVYFLILLAVTGLILIIHDKTLLKPFIIFIVLSFGLSAYFWLPALLEKHYILLSVVPIADRNLYFPNFAQLFIPSLSSASLHNETAGFSYQLGLPFTILVVGFILTLLSFLKINVKNEKTKFIYLSILATILILFGLFLSNSKFIWENTPFLKEINYPWTLLGPLAFLISLASGYLAKGNKSRLFVGLVSIVAVLTVFPLAKPQMFINRDDSYYLTNSATTTSSDELMPLWVKNHPLKVAEKKVITSEIGYTTNEIFNKSNNFSFTITTQKNQLIRVNKIYYPGWEVYVNNVKEKINYNNPDGIITFPVKSGVSNIFARFVETPTRLLSDILSAVTLMITIVIIFLTPKLKKWLFK